MADTKQYGYYIKGNKVSIVQKDTSFDNNVDNRDFGERVKLSDLQRQIFSVPEIRFSNIDNFSEDIQLGFNEILQLNNVEINIEFV